MIPKLLTGALLLAGLAAPLLPHLLAGTQGDSSGSPETAPAEAAVAAGSPGARGTELLALARARTPFRIGGAPPAFRWGESPPPPPPSRPVVERPRLVLSGILWGREPVAILEGIPGQEQPLALREGVAVGGFRVTRIERTRATVAGQDTVWTLEVRNPWP